MTAPFWTSDNGATTLEMYCGHVLDVLRELPEGSAHTVVTSPPYWGLRDYGLPPLVWGGDPGCGHEWSESVRTMQQGSANPDPNISTLTGGREKYATTEREVRDATCVRCGAWRGSLGLEPTPDLYVQHMVEVFREVRRVLRDDGTVWLNMGDSYAGQPSGSFDNGQRGSGMGGGEFRANKPFATVAPGIKPKDLLGMPWRVAFALQADGWYLRSDIIWSKPNPMPESVTDRPTKSHEYLFLLARSDRYYYDADAIREP